MSNAMPLFPVYLNSPGFVPPATGMYYLVSKDGIYMRMERQHGSAMVKVSEIPFLQDAPKTVNLTLPKVPGKIIALALSFFREVFKQHRSESYVTLLYSKKLNDFRLWCPNQRVGYSSVSYDRTDSIPFEESIGCAEGPQYSMIGTIHSHCDFSAFHSGTDTSDEASFDGIHITLGHVNQESFSMVSSVVFSDNRSQKSPLEVVDGVVDAYSEDVEEKGWLKGIVTSRKEFYFNLNLSPEDQAWIDENCQKTVDEWMTKVTKVVYVSKGYDVGTWNKMDSFRSKQELWDEGGTTSLGDPIGDHRSSAGGSRHLGLPDENGIYGWEGPRYRRFQGD